MNLTKVILIIALLLILLFNLSCTNEAEKNLNMGLDFYKQGKYEEAIKCYDKAIELNPKYAVAWNNKGLSLTKLHKLEEAIKCYDKALELEPSYSIAKTYKEDAVKALEKKMTAPTNSSGGENVNQLNTGKYLNDAHNAVNSTNQ